MVTEGQPDWCATVVGDQVAESCAVAPSGTLLVAYVPPAHSGPITVDMGSMSGPTMAR